MNKNLQSIFSSFVEQMKAANGVLGAWHFGSVSHGTSDEHSDFDLIFLIEEAHFKEMEAACSAILSKICDAVILCWGEGFNNKAITSNSYLLKKDSQVLQFDVVLLNQEHIWDFMCKIHYTDLAEKDIIFDTNNQVRQLSMNCPHGKLWKDNVERQIKTYLLYFHMTKKYLLRQDYFKLNQAMRMLYDIHVSILLTAHDKITWGGAENKLHFLATDKQEHLKYYYCTDDFALNRQHLLNAVEWFEEDLQELSELKKLEYRLEPVTIVKKDWITDTNSLC